MLWQILQIIYRILDNVVARTASFLIRCLHHCRGCHLRSVASVESRIALETSSSIASKAVVWLYCYGGTTPRKIRSTTTEIHIKIQVQTQVQYYSDSKQFKSQNIRKNNKNQNVEIVFRCYRLNASLVKQFAVTYQLVDASIYLRQICEIKLLYSF